MAIIGISGFIGSGKDTIASYLATNHGYKQYSFASILKDATSAIFGWERDMIEGRTVLDRKERETNDSFWSNRLGKEWSPRIALQYIGTELFRDHLHQDIWIYALERKLIHETGNVVISDVRFPNEVAMIRRLGGEVWRVNKRPYPEWYDQKKTSYPNVHYSEWALLETPHDFVIDNDSSLELLYRKIKQRIE